MNAAPLALNACAASVFRLVEAHSGDATIELIGRVREQASVFVERTEHNSHLHARAHIKTVNDVDLRLRTPRLHVQRDINLMPIFSATQMSSKGLQISMTVGRCCRATSVWNHENERPS
jgi:hypothetical protein